MTFLDNWIAMQKKNKKEQATMIDWLGYFYKFDGTDSTKRKAS